MNNTMFHNHRILWFTALLSVFIFQRAIASDSFILLGERINTNQIESVALYEKLTKNAEQGDLDSQVLAGLMQSMGASGVEKDPQAAFTKISDASSKGNADAHFAMYLMKASGTGTTKDVQIAKTYYDMALKNKSPMLMTLISYSDEASKTHSLSHQDRLGHITRAANNGNLFAIYFLAYAHEHGKLGLPANRTTANIYYKEAAERGSSAAKLYLALQGYDNNKNAEKLNATIEELIDADYEPAIIYKAFALLGGNGTYQKDVNQGVALLQHSANQGNVKSIKHLVFIHFSDDIVQKDLSKAKTILDKAIYQQHIKNGELYFLMSATYFELYGQSKQSFHYLTLAAQYNHAAAHYLLGLLYADGDKFVQITKDESKAFTHFQKAYELDKTHTDNLIELSKCYEQGFGVEKDETKANELFVELAELGDDNAMLKIALNYDLDNKYNINSEQYINYLKQLDENKQGVAYWLLAQEYQKGKLIEQDYKKAFQLWQKVIDSPDASRYMKGDAYAQLASYYKSDIGTGLVEKNLDTYIELLEKSASLGHVSSVDDLAWFYYFGAPDDKPDYEKSFIYFNKLIELTDADIYLKDAHYSLGRQYNLGRGTKVNHALAAKHLEKAMALGSTAAMVELAEMYLYGTGFEADQNKAIKLLTEAKSKGDVFAYHELATLYVDGYFVPQDIRKAENLYKEALAENPDQYDAKFLKKHLNELYEEYPDLKPEFFSTYKSIERNAKKGDANAIIKLAFLYENGLIVEKNWDKTVALLTNLVNQNHAEATYELSYFYNKHAAEYPNMGRRRCELREKAADLGYPIAMLFVASDYQFEKNECGGENIGKAIAYGERVFANGKYRNEAASLLEHFYFIEKDYAQSYKYGHYLVENNLPEHYFSSGLYFRLGYMYENGLGTKKNIRTAIKMYRAAAEKDHEKAKSRLEALSENGML